jgi:N-acetylglutamate synthase-like GNAT family acetyltransferase
MASVTLRPMTASVHDIDGVLALSQSVSWPHRREDWILSIRLGHGVLAEHDGQIVGCAMWWLYGEDFATCGGIIVSPSMQGRGLGKALMAHLLSETGERPVFLSSTEAGERLYQSLGFEVVGTACQHRAQIPAATGLSGATADKALREAREEDLPAMVQLDQRAFGTERYSLIHEFNRIGSAVVIERDGAIQGFAMCRLFGFGSAVGPVVARTEEEARLLIGYFIEAKAGGLLRVDITNSSDLGEWLTAQGLPEVDRETMMVRGKRSLVPGPEHEFGLASRSYG